MRDTEILAYAVKDGMADFIEYVKDEVLDGNGNTAVDSDGRFITGIIPWMEGREIPEARFFCTDPADETVKLFVAVMRPPDDEEQSVPWMRDVPGLKDRVRTDGVIGSTPNFGSAIPQGMQTPLDFVVPRPDLDDLFHTLQDNIRSIDFSRLDFEKQDLLDALQGKEGTNLRELMSRIEETLDLNIREHQLKTAR
ncbi:MAG TPA: hypothetical protein VJT69_05135 [Pyrinomonadaceae bacterium]|nr:hypothetical protein [Pyrinomonadaceae bacterium]